MFKNDRKVAPWNHWDSRKYGLDYGYHPTYMSTVSFPELRRSVSRKNERFPAVLLPLTPPAPLSACHAMHGHNDRHGPHVNELVCGGGAEASLPSSGMWSVRHGPQRNNGYARRTHSPPPPDQGGFEHALSNALNHPTLTPKNIVARAASIRAIHTGSFSCRWSIFVPCFSIRVLFLFCCMICCGE